MRTAPEASRRIHGFSYLLLAVLLGGVVVGCGQPAMEMASSPKFATREPMLLDSSRSMESRPSSALTGAAGEGLEITPVAAVERKIIYVATVQLVTKDFDAALRRLPEIVKAHGGYVGNASDDARVQSQRSGTWQCRIPVERYEDFLAAILELGVRETSRQEAQDVTEEYVDLDARLSNQRKLEERILEVLAKAEDKIADIIEVERELARVRGVIEQIEGRLRYLNDRTAFTTVNLTIREQRDYVPPETPTLAGRVSGAFGDSLANLQVFGENVLVAFVYAGPWLLMWAIVLTPVVLLLRFLYRRLLPPRRATPAQVLGSPS